jgi:hypothetical protein
MKTFEFNGRTFECDHRTIFYLEIGRYENAYVVAKTFADVPDALIAYDHYKVSNGFKKRLVMSNDGKKTVLGKVISKR